MIIVAGGTGGHIFPALYLYKQCKYDKLEPFFISDTRSKNYESKMEGIINKHYISIKDSKNKLLFLLSFIVSFFKSFCLFIKIKPDLVVSFGSYISIAPTIVAVILRKKIILHESNTVLGRSLKIFISDKIILSCGFEDLYSNYSLMDKNKFIYTGNPIAQNICFSPIKRLDKKNISIGVFGGSQGSDYIDNIISQAISKISQIVDIKINIVHQCRTENIYTIKKLYKQHNILSDVKTFFPNINEIIKNDIHIVICRAGAQSITEINTLGRVVIYIPYPYATDNHQSLNAKAISKKKHIFIINQKNDSFNSIIQKIKYIINNFDSLNKEIKESKKAYQNLFELVCAII